MNVTNIHHAVTVLKSMAIETKQLGTSIQVKMDESEKMAIILQLNKEKVVIYDFEEIYSMSCLSSDFIDNNI